MTIRSRAAARSSRPLVLFAVVLIGALAGCSDDDGGTAEPKGDCPVAPVQVVVSVDQWGDIVRELAGDCAEVTTIVDGSTGDPHEFEPTPSDVAAFDGADLVLVNGLGYDTWATDAVESSSGDPVVVDAGEIAGSTAGDNPHVWYDPTVVRETATATTQALQQVSPREAEEYYTDRFQRWEQGLAPYDAAIERIRTGAAGRPYAATESVFDLMATAVGLTDVTPEGYRDAAANESEPTPADVAGFESVLRDRGAAVLVDNTQTEGPLPQQLSEVARTAGVPVVEVTETVPADAGSFVEWQVAQLDALAAALGL
jgi:zinc/manganese transport system substrate-binding protein